MDIFRKKAKKDDLKPKASMMATFVSNMLQLFAAIVLTTFGVVIIGVIFYIWGSQEVGQRLDIGYGTSTNPRLVQLEIGDKHFAIPQNYIWSRDRWSGGKVSGVNMHALLPDFEPVTEANEKEFDKPGWHRKMSLLLSEHNIPGSRTSSPSMTRNEVYERVTRNKEITNEPGPYELTRQHQKPSSVDDDELDVGNKHDGSFYWVKCSPDNSVLFPACSTYVSYSNQVHVKYTFAKRYLSDWQAIDDGVLRLIAQFENNNTKNGE